MEYLKELFKQGRCITLEGRKYYPIELTVDRFKDYNVADLVTAKFSDLQDGREACITLSGTTHIIGELVAGLCEG